MSIARDISRQTRRSIVEVTSVNAGTNFTVSGGFSGSSLDVYLNGAKLIINSDYSLNGTSGIILNQAAVDGDVIEFVSRNTSSVINVVDTSAIIDEAVTFDKLSDSATESSNVQKRTAKAWVNFDGTFGSSPFTEANGGIRQALNINSISDLGVGQYRLNFNVAFADAGYCATAGVNGINVSSDMFIEIRTVTTTYLDVWSVASNLSATRDSTIVCVAVFGELS